jgi:hypothetical protein
MRSEPNSAMQTNVPARTGILLLIATIVSACATTATRVDEPAKDPGPAADSTSTETDTGAEIDGAEEFVVTIGESWMAESGLTVLVRELGHEHWVDEEEPPAGEYVPEDPQPVKPSMTTNFLIEIGKGEDVEVFEYSYSDTDPCWYVEGIAHGHVFVVESLFPFGEQGEVLTEPADLEKNGQRKVTLIPTDREPLDKEQVRDSGAAMGISVADEIGCEGTLTAGAPLSVGTYDHAELTDFGEIDSVCRILVGVYTGTAFISMGGKKWIEKPDSAPLPTE